MGLKDVAQKATAAGFNVAGDIKRTVTLVQVTSTDYDPDAGTTTESTSTQDVDGILKGFSAYEIANNIAEAQDKRFIYEQAKVSSGPSVLNRVEIDGIAHQIVRWEQDPAKATYRLHLRA